MTFLRWSRLQAGATPSSLELDTAIKDRLRQEIAHPPTKADWVLHTVELLLHTAPPEQRRAMWELLHPQEPESNNGD